jgi:hypothetical protein
MALSRFQSSAFACAFKKIIGLKANPRDKARHLFLLLEEFNRVVLAG